MFHFPKEPSYEERQAYVMRKVIAEMWGLLDDGQKERMRRSQREAAERIARGEDVPDWLETWQAPDGLRFIAGALVSQSKLALSAHRNNAEQMAFAFMRGELSDAAEMQRRVEEVAMPYLEWLDLDLMATHIQATAERMEKESEGGDVDGD